MVRLPQPGGDSGEWGQILNEYILISHNEDGSLKDVPISKVTDLTSILSSKVTAEGVDAKIADQLSLISSEYVPFLDSQPGLMGIRKKISTTYGTGWVFGNASSFGFSGTGTPLEIAGAFGIYQEYGKQNPRQPITKTTQGGYAVTNYWGPTVDDVAEGFSSAVILKDSGAPWTQNLTSTAMEAISQVEGNVTLAGKAVGMSSTIKMVDNAQANYGYSFLAQNYKTGLSTSILDTYIAYGQVEGGSATYNFAVKVVDPIETQSRISLIFPDGDGIYSVDRNGVAVSNGASPFVRILPRSDTDLVSLRIGAAAGQTQAMQEWWKSGSTVPALQITKDGDIVTRGTSVQVRDSGGGYIVGLNGAGLKAYSSSIFSTGATSTTLGSNSPAVTSTPNTWMKIGMPDGTTGYIPVWK